MKYFFPFLMFAICFRLQTASATTLTGASISVAIDPGVVVGQVPNNFSGMCQGSDDVNTFYPGNQSLVNLFGTLGIHHLSLKSGAFTNAQLDNLFGFAKAANLKVLLMMELDAADVNTTTHQTVASFETHVQQSLSQITYIITRNYLPYIDSFCMGNEPDFFSPSWSYQLDYEPAWTRYVSEIETGLAAYRATPNGPVTPLGPVMFCGPSAANNQPPVFFMGFTQDFSTGGSRFSAFGQYISFATQHLYLIGSSSQPYTGFHDAQKMLQISDSDNQSAYQYLCGYKTLPTTLSKPLLPYRQEETGAYSQHGVKGASDVFSDSLWNLDYEYWWASHGCLGLDYCQLAGGAYNTYQLTTSGSGSTTVTALANAYGLLTFQLGASAASSLLGTTVGTPSAIPSDAALDSTYNFAAYAAQASDQSVYVTLINRDNGTDGASGVPSTVSVNLPAGYSIVGAAAISLNTSLTGGAGNISTAATSSGGIYLGGSAVDTQGNLTPHWSSLTPSLTNSISVSVPGASATVLKLNVKHLLGFTQWEAQPGYFTATQLQTPAISGPLAAPLGDGIPNLLKYACDINPAVPMDSSELSALPSVMLSDINGTSFLTLTYRQNASATGITVSLQSSTDLMDWSMVVTPDYYQNLGPGTGDPFIEMGIKADTATDAKQFIRLAVTSS